MRDFGCVSRHHWRTERIVSGSGGQAIMRPQLSQHTRSQRARHIWRNSKPQRLGLLHLRQRLHLGEHVRRHRAVDLDQRDRVAALLVAAEVEGRDVDLGVAEQAREAADEARLVLDW